MSIAIDTNVIVEMVAGDPHTAGQAAETLQELGSREALLICPIVYSELHAHPGWRKADVDAFLSSTDILVDWDLLPAMWSRAGATYAAYARRRARALGGPPRRLVADFVIGAHAETVGGLVTAEKSFYSTNFSGLRVVFL